MFVSMMVQMLPAFNECMKKIVHKKSLSMFTQGTLMAIFHSNKSKIPTTIL